MLGGETKLAMWMLTAYPFALFGGMLAAARHGRLWRRQHLAEEAAATGGMGSAIPTGILALLGLLLAFTFATAYSRLGARRTLIVEETNNIGTLWQRTDLLPDRPAAEVRAALREYVDSRIC